MVLLSTLPRISIPLCAGLSRLHVPQKAHPDLARVKEHAVETMAMYKNILSETDTTKSNIEYDH